MTNEAAILVLKLWPLVSLIALFILIRIYYYMGKVNTLENVPTSGWVVILVLSALPPLVLIMVITFGLTVLGLGLMLFKL